MSDTEGQTHLFESLHKEYLEKRKQFEEERSSENNHRLFERVRTIIAEATDDTRFQNAGIITGTGATITVADLTYGDLIKPGESAVLKATYWIPCGQREVNGVSLGFSVRFGCVDFVKVVEQEHQRRLGTIRIDGELTDQDGVSAHFPLAYISENLQSQKFQLLWNFGNEIPYGSEDYSEVVKIIESTEKQLGIV